MANNHNGSVALGKRIIRELRAVCADYPFRFAVKLQYRDFPACIHPDYRARLDLKYVRRFTETALSWDQYRELREEITAAGFLSACTPWDERSVEKIIEHGYDFLKIPSCYLTDWPLLESIAATCPPSLPLIASTAATPLLDLDRVVSFFTHRRRDLSLLHCVGEYPCPDSHLHLGQIALLHDRYPSLSIGYSTHEDPLNFESVKIAIGLGARIFEKHVGVENLNDYSANPDQVAAWLHSAQRAFDMIGERDQRYSPSRAELRAMSDLARGAYAYRPISAGQPILPADIYFAMPCTGLPAQEFSKYSQFTSSADIAENAPVTNVTVTNSRDRVLAIVAKVKSLLLASAVPVPGECVLEISHHYGMDQFDQFGVTAVTVVNSTYCKKLLIVLPGQQHPEQWHKQKEETFHILHGDLCVVLNNEPRPLKANDIVTIRRQVHHSFSSASGAVIEEISSSHSPADSFYTDDRINQNQNRKTFVSYWM